MTPVDVNTENNAPTIQLLLLTASPRFYVSCKPVTSPPTAQAISQM